MTLQMGKAACVLGPVSERDAFEEITKFIPFELSFLNLFVIAVFFEKLSSGSGLEPIDWDNCWFQ